MMLRSIPIKQITRVFHATGLKICSSILALTFGIVGVRLLGSEIFGAYVSLITFAGLLTVATSLGLPGLLQREVAATRGSGDRSAFKPLLQGLFAINGAIVLALFLSVLFAPSWAAAVLFFCLAGNLAGTLGALFAAHERILLAHWLGDFLRPLVALVFLVLVMNLRDPSELLPLFSQIAGASAAVLALAMLWRGAPLTGAFRFLGKPFWSDRHRAVLKSGVVFAGTQLLINLTTQVDILILTALASPEDVAHYYAAVRAGLIVSFFFGASAMLAEPSLTRLFALADKDGIQALTTRTAAVGVAVTSIASIAALVLAPFYFELYGPDFSNAFPSLAVFVAGLVCLSLFGPSQALMRATRLEGSLLVCTAVALAINGVVSVILVSLLGIVGAAIGTSLQFAAYGALMAGLLWKKRLIRCDVFS